MASQSAQLFSVSSSTPEGGFLHGRAAASGSAYAGAEFHRGIDLSAGFQVSANIGADLGDKVRASLSGGVQAGAGLAVQAVFPIDLFTEAGLLARLRARAEASGNVAATVSLPLDEFRDLVRVRLTGPTRDLAEIFFSEVVVDAGLWARVGFAAELTAEAVLVGSLLPDAEGGPGFTASAEYGVGLGFKSGAQFVANIGFTDPGRLLLRLADATASILAAEAEAYLRTLPAAEAPLVRPAVAALRFVVPTVTRAAFQLGLAVAAADKDARDRAVDSIVGSLLGALQRLLLDCVFDLAVDELAAHLRSAPVLGAVADLDAHQRTELVGVLRDLRAAVTTLSQVEPSAVSELLMTALRCLDAVEEVLALGMLPAPASASIRQGAALLWCAATLAHRVAEWSDDPDAALDELFGAAQVPIPQRGILAGRVAEQAGKAAGTPLTLADLVEFVVGADLLDDLRQRLPDASAILDRVTAATGVPIAQLAKQLLVDLTDPARNADDLLDTLGTALADLVVDLVVPRVVAPLADRSRSSPELVAFIEQAVVPALVAFPTAVLPNLDQLGDETGRRRLSEALSAVLLQSLGDLTLTSIDVLATRALTDAAPAVREVGRAIAELGEQSLAFTALLAVATGANLPIRLLPDDVAGLLDLVADVIEQLNRPGHAREALIDAMRRALSLGLGSDATRQAALARLTDTDAIVVPDDLDRLLARLADGVWDLVVLVVPRLLQLFALHFVNEAKLIARWIAEGARLLVAAAEQAVEWLGRTLEQLRLLLDQLVRQAGELLAKILGDVRALTGYLTGLVNTVVDQVKTAGLAIIDPLLVDLPDWLRDAIRGLFTALLDAIKWLATLPLQILGSVAGWVEALLIARLATATSDEQALRSDVRARIAAGFQADITMNLRLEAWGQTILDLGQVTIPAGTVAGAVADVVLGDPVFTATVRQAATDGLSVQGLRTQAQTVGQQVDGLVSRPEAQVLAGQLAPGLPLAVRFPTPAADAIVSPPQQVRVVVDGANRTFAEPTLGVPPRVTVAVNGIEYVCAPGLWHEVTGGIELVIELLAPEPVPGFVPPHRVAGGRGIQLDSAQAAVPTLVKAQLAPADQVVFTPATQAAAIELGVGDREGPLSARAVGVLPPGALASDRSTLTAWSLRARTTGQDPFINTPATVRLTGQAQVVSLQTYGEPAPAAPAGQPARAPVPMPVDTAGRAAVPGLAGVNVVQVSVSDGKGRSASGAVSFFLRVQPQPQPPVVIDDIVAAPPGPDWRSEYVMLRSTVPESVALTGWTLRDLAGHRYRIPTFTLAPGARVRIWTGPGQDAGTDLYWGRRAAVWNNPGDAAVLADPAGNEVHRYFYGRSG